QAGYGGTHHASSHTNGGCMPDGTEPATGLSLRRLPVSRADCASLIHRRLQNRELAMNALRARLYDAERQRLDSARTAERRRQIGTAERSERVRTYNYPQVTSHRVGR